MTDEEAEIKRIMREKDCSRKQAERAYNARIVTLHSLTPELTPKPQPIEESEGLIKPDFNERKAKILDRIEDQLDELDERSDLAEKIESSEDATLIVKKFLGAITFLQQSCNRFVLTARFNAETKRLFFAYEFYKDGKEVLPKIIHGSKGDEVIAEVVEEDEEGED